MEAHEARVICSTCKIEKCIADFHKKSSTKSGKCIHCKLCMNAKRRWQYREYTRSSELDAMKKRHKDNPQYKMFARAKDRARKQGLPFNLTIEDIVIPLLCPVLGISIEVGKKIFNDRSPSLDRLIPEKGYVKDNTIVMSYRANRIKNDGTLDEFKRLVAWMQSQN